MRQKIYIESTVWYQMVNYSDSEFKDRAEQLFNLIDEQKYYIFISNIVLEEISHNSKRYRNRLEELISKYSPLVIFQNNETEILAEAYIENAYKHRNKKDVLCDAFHAAIATSANISYIVTYNYRNLLNITTIEHLNSVNLLAGYNNKLSILPPFMFLDLKKYKGEKGTVDDLVWVIKKKYGNKLEELQKKPISKRISYHKKFTNRAISKLSLETLNINQRVRHL